MIYMSYIYCQCVRLKNFFFSSRRRHTRWPRDWSSDVCSSDLGLTEVAWMEPPSVRPNPGCSRCRSCAQVRPTTRGRGEIGRASCREREEISRIDGAERKTVGGSTEA